MGEHKLPKINGSEPEPKEMKRPENYAEIAMASIDLLVAILNDFTQLAATANAAGAKNFEEQLLGRAREIAGYVGGLQALMAEVKEKQLHALILPSQFNQPH
jgi:hypothetical protein